ncbi:MAG: hypothetical protein NDI73_10300 [Desulfuromonadales bacterium]|nr:hypothetical protein [Desulfuromonadales bacterium]
MRADHKGKGTRESGMALIIAIGFLAILSIIGAVVLDVATRDLAGSGTLTPVRKAFYTADRAVEYSMNREILTNISPSGAAINLMTGTTSGGIVHKAIINSVNVADGQLISGFVTDLGAKSLPSSMASYFGSEFGANVYHVSAEAKAGPSSREQKINVDASIVRLFKLDDDTIFRTSGGG